MSVSYGLIRHEEGTIPRRAVWLKQNCGVRTGCSGVRDMMRRGGSEGIGSGGGGGGSRFQIMPASMFRYVLVIDRMLLSFSVAIVTIL